MRYFLLPLLLCLNTAYATDSSSLQTTRLNTVVSPFLLAHGELMTTTQNIHVNQETTSLRCPENATPILMSSVKSVEVYGAAQAIEGIKNTLTLNPDNYRIIGEVSSPVNVAAGDNGVTVNWQVWCHPQGMA